ncbi:MAG TPA: low specificity L-threonine aldolase [Solirubrobacteraceae bacterium]|nr:low specificity L-threonine aldolase [Solirubrobacteraceae bacterium]
MSELRPRGFASDNAAGVHPEVLAAIAAVNDGHALAYGHDPYTQRIEAKVAAQFGDRARAFFVFNGSAANVLSLRAACRPWEGAICAESAHVNVDECGAAESLAGIKLLTVATDDGKLTPALAERRLERIGDEHVVQPRVLTVSQSTELGTVYDPGELRALASFAHEHGLVLHVDGSRLTNAAAALGVSLGEASTAAGADIVSFGGTKNGLLGGEAVVFADPRLADGFLYLRKQTLQLASKMRFIAAQFDAYLDGELWRRNATHANAMAARLRDAVAAIDGVRLSRETRANVVFATLPAEAIEPLQDRFSFYTWDERTNEVRWMCAWDTTEPDVDAFVDTIAQQLAGDPTRA